MSQPPSYKQDPRTVVTMNGRLWSAEVASAEAAAVLQGEAPLAPREVDYEFSNGRRFYKPTDTYGNT